MGELNRPTTSSAVTGAKTSWRWQTTKPPHFLFFFFEIPCTYAAEGGGHSEVMKWLRSEGCPWDVSTCLKAAEGGHLDVLEWAIENGCPYEVNEYTREGLKELGLARASQPLPSSRQGLILSSSSRSRRSD